MLSTRRRLICLICAHPLPHRIQWWWNTRKERDDHIQQTNINQSCIAQQITLVLVRFTRQRTSAQTNDFDPFVSLQPDERQGSDYSSEQMITCEAENPYGVGRDSLFFKGKSIEFDRTELTFVSSLQPHPPSSIKNQRCKNLLAHRRIQCSNQDQQRCMDPPRTCPAHQ